MANMSVSAGRRKGPSSPSSSTHPSPSTLPTSLPRLKLSLRPTPTPPPTARPHPKTYARQSRSNGAGPSNPSHQRKTFIDDSDSDLTPAEEDDDDDDEDEDMDDHQSKITPRNRKDKSKVEVTPRSAKASTTKTKKGTAAGSLKKKSGVASPKTTMMDREGERNKKSVGTDGPGGRERKKQVKVGDKERKRARDEKLGFNGGDGFDASTTRRRRSPLMLSSDSESSYGDDESDHDSPFASSLQPYANGTINGFAEAAAMHEDSEQDVEMDGLPTAFAGQEIEDLAYGGGRIETEMERQVLSGLWEDDEDEDEELFISQLSGSEADLQSQSSVHESDSDETSSEESSTDDELDEFGFPRPTTSAPTTEDGPLVLMENWDGQFVLVQPRQDRSRRRRGSKGSRESRTAGSVGGSTVLSTTDQQALIIDADAEDADSSEWSGESDEECCGDTTDSMEEDDMPMLDSPALDMIIGEQMGGLAAIGGVGEELDLSELLEVTDTAAPPSIVITDMTGPSAMSEQALQTPASALPTTYAQPPPPPTAFGTPASPATPAPMPTMGTFHPTTDDPSSHAVIDGSKTTTKSPFTHRRRSRRERADSISTTHTNGTNGTTNTVSMMGSMERKRKSANANTPTTPAYPDAFFPSTLPKRARYSSIPGHPRFVAAMRQAERERMALLEEEETSEEEVCLDLEDMLETEILAHDSSHGMGHGHMTPGQYRFDRVPVSTYLRRNFGVGANGARMEVEDIMAYSSPVGARGMMSFGLAMNQGYAPGIGLGMGSIGGEYAHANGVAGDGGWGLGDTLAGPPARMMLVSPGLPAVREGEEEVMSRKEKRRRKKVDANASAAVAAAGLNEEGAMAGLEGAESGTGVVPALQI